MRYRVRGIHLGTGKETVLVVNAKHHEAAEAVARREMTVTEVVPEGGLVEPEDFGWEPPEDADEVASAVARAAPAEPKRARHRFRGATRLAVVIVALVVVAALFGWWRYR